MRSDSLSVMWLSSAKMAELIEVLFGVEIPLSRRNTLLGGGPSPTARGEGERCALHRI